MELETGMAGGAFWLLVLVAVEFVVAPPYLGELLGFIATLIAAGWAVLTALLLVVGPLLILAWAIRHPEDVRALWLMVRRSL